MSRGGWEARAIASGPVRPSSAAQLWMCGQSRWPSWRSSSAVVSARIIAVMAVLRSRIWPGSKDTSHPCGWPGACRAVWPVWSLVMAVSLMVRVMASLPGVRVMVRLPGRALVRGCGRAWFPGARRETVADLAASRGAGRRRSRTRDGLVAGGRRSRGTGGHRGPASRACPCPLAAGQGHGDRRVDGGFLVRPVSCRGLSLAGLLVGCEPGLTGLAGWLALAVVWGRGGVGGLEHAVGDLVVGPGVVEAGLAGGAG